MASPPSPSASTISIIGAGSVGSTIAYSLILNPIASTILLVDPQESLRDAQVQDLSDATYHAQTSATKITAASHKQAGAESDIIVMTAGAAQKEGESRTDLIGRNLKILKSAIDDLKPFGKKDVVLLLVANPVDVLTYFAQKYSGLDRTRVLGSGTFLDSARLRGILADRAHVAASSIDAYVLGEHGDSQVVARSCATIGGIPIDRVVDENEIDWDAIATETKEKAAAIMESKGATAFGVGGVVASICTSILFDRRNVVPISHFQDDLKCCLSMPAVLGRQGVLKTISMPLDKQEEQAVQKSAEELVKLIQDAEKESE